MFWSARGSCRRFARFSSILNLLPLLPLPPPLPPPLPLNLEGKLWHNPYIRILCELGHSDECHYTAMFLSIPSDKGGKSSHLHMLSYSELSKIHQHVPYSLYAHHNSDIWLVWPCVSLQSRILGNSRRSYRSHRLALCVDTSVRKGCFIALLKQRRDLETRVRQYCSTSFPI